MNSSDEDEEVKEEALTKADIGTIYDSFMCILQADASTELSRLEPRAQLIMTMAVHARLAFSSLTQLLASGPLEVPALKNAITAGVRDAVAEVLDMTDDGFDRKQKVLDAGDEMADYVVAAAQLLREKGMVGETLQ